MRSAPIMIPRPGETLIMGEQIPPLMPDESAPQLENGYTRIANELLEAILRYGFTKQQLLVLFAVIRRTYGWGKKTDDMALTRLAQLTGIKLPHVSKAVRALEAANVLLKRSGRYGYVLGVKKDFSKWRMLPNQSVVTESVMQCDRIGKFELPNQSTEKKYRKETIKTAPSASILFTEAMAIYPKRIGGNSTADARKAWCARLREGVTETAMLDGVKRYAAYCRADGSEHSKYVKQAKTFFGPGEHWKEEWATADTQQRSLFAGAI